jgi:hypothetical protein
VSHLVLSGTSWQRVQDAVLIWVARFEVRCALVEVDWVLTDMVLVVVLVDAIEQCSDWSELVELAALALVDSVEQCSDWSSNYAPRERQAVAEVPCAVQVLSRDQRGTWLVEVASCRVTVDADRSEVADSLVVQWALVDL